MPPAQQAGESRLSYRCPSMRRHSHARYCLAQPLRALHARHAFGARSPRDRRVTVASPGRHRRASVAQVRRKCRATAAPPPRWCRLTGAFQPLRWRNRSNTPCFCQLRQSRVAMTIARILIIAGSDSGGGAGIQADIKTATMLGSHAMTAITAITAQNTLGVTAIHPVPVEMVLAQIDAVTTDIGVDAVKIGMIGSAQIAHAVAGRLEMMNIPIVFDPVMVATSGSILADPDTTTAFERLMAIATVTTPNLDELAVLGGRDAVLDFGCHLVEKGGHAPGPEVRDRLYAPGGMLVAEMRGARIDTDHTHGTGCTFASALACGLGTGMSIDEAFRRAVRYTRLALIHAPALGQGHGPIGHSLGGSPFDKLER